MVSKSSATISSQAFFVTNNYIIYVKIMCLFAIAPCIATESVVNLQFRKLAYFDFVWFVVGKLILQVKLIIQMISYCMFHYLPDVSTVQLHSVTHSHFLVNGLYVSPCTAQVMSSADLIWKNSGVRYHNTSNRQAYQAEFAFQNHHTVALEFLLLSMHQSVVQRR